MVDGARAPQAVEDALMGVNGSGRTRPARGEGDLLGAHCAPGVESGLETRAPVREAYQKKSTTSILRWSMIGGQGLRQPHVVAAFDRRTLRETRR